MMKEEVSNSLVKVMANEQGEPEVIEFLGQRLVRGNGEGVDAFFARAWCAAPPDVELETLLSEGKPVGTA